MLRDEAGPPFSLEAFKAFAASQLAEENINFWIEARASQVNPLMSWVEEAKLTDSRVPQSRLLDEHSASANRGIISFACVPNSHKVLLLQKSRGVTVQHTYRNSSILGQVSYVKGSGVQVFMMT